MIGGKIKAPKFKTILFLLVITPILCEHNFSKNNAINQNLSKTIKRAYSEQEELFTNVDKIDDGAVYFIRNAANTNFIWDMPNGNVAEGVEPIICTYNGFGNQRFIVREETKYNGKMYYTISPLYAPTKTLRINDNTDKKNLVLGSDKNTSLVNFLSNKFMIEKSSYGFTITTGVSTFGKYIVPKDGQIADNVKLEQITSANVTSTKSSQWEFCKTDSLGVDLENKIRINGTSTRFFNLTPPSLGEFIIETKQYGSDLVDTYLELYDRSGNNRLAYSDDIEGANNRYSRITYNFTSVDDVQVRVRGFSANEIGYVYLLLRPKNPLYFAGVYDYDKNNNDRPSTLKEAQQFLPNHYLDVQSNRGVDAILELAPNGKKKINSEYFVFSGHGYSNVAGVEFYNSTNPEGFLWYDIPSLNDTKIAIWMTCHGARNYFKYGSTSQMTSMAYQSIYMGADYSLGYVGSIYDTTQRAFPKKFFDALQTNSIPDAVTIATKKTIDANWWWWTFYGKSKDDFKNPILYKKGDSLNTTCGNGNYDLEANAESMNVEMFDKISHNGYVMNIDNNANDIMSINSLYSNSSVESLFPYKFISNYDGKLIKLGFKCDENTGEVIYYDFINNYEISSEEFELYMGEPNEKILNQLKLQKI